MNEPRPPSSRASSTKIAIALVALGVVIASVGGAIIVSLRAERTPSTFLVGPDVPLEAGDRVRARVGAVECPATVLAASAAEIVVEGCAGAPPASVARSALTMDAYRAGVLEPRVGDGVLVLVGGRFERGTVLGIESSGRIRVEYRSGKGAPSATRSIEARAAFLVRPSAAR